MWLVAAFTFTLSAAIATTVEGFDAGKLAGAIMPPSLTVPTLIVMTLGVTCKNLVPLFAGGFALLTMGVKVTRKTATIITAVAGAFIPVYGVFQESFAYVFSSFVLLLAILIVPWFVITMIDYFVIHKRDYSHDDLYSAERGIGGEFFTPGIVTWVISVVAGFLFGNTAVYSSPIVMKFFGGADLSLIVSGILALLLYYPWALRVKASARKISVLA